MRNKSRIKKLESLTPEHTPSTIEEINQKRISLAKHRREYLGKDKAIEAVLMTKEEYQEYLKEWKPPKPPMSNSEKRAIYKKYRGE